MTKQEYLQKRNELMANATNMLTDGKVEESNTIQKEIEKLDSDFETEAVAAQNLRVLENTGIASPIVNSIFDTSGVSFNQGDVIENKDDLGSAEYRGAFLSNLMGKQLTTDQQDVFNKVNASVEDNIMLIPNTTSAKIWEKVDELYPFYAGTTKTNVKGTFTLVQEDVTSDAEFYDEDTETKTGKVGTTETFKTYQLSGCELSRCIDVSWKLKEMAMDDFENYIVTKMAKKMGAGAAHSSMTGKGKPGKDDQFKPEPNGVVTVLKAESGTPQVVSLVDDPGYKDVTKLISLVTGAYKKGLYATSDYIWNVLANILDGNGKPYFITDTTSGGVGKMFGVTVFEDDSVPLNCMVCGDPSQYQINFNKQITLDTEDTKKKRITSYIGYAIIDGAPITNKAFSLLEKTSAKTK